MAKIGKNNYQMLSFLEQIILFLVIILLIIEIKPKFNWFLPLKRKKKNMKTFTKTDYEILRVMTEKKEFSSVKIAKELGVSDKTVRNRMKSMKTSGAYKKVLVVDPTTFGYTLIVDFFLKVKKEDVDKVTKWLLTKYSHNISYLGRHWGGDNISIQTLFKNSSKAEDFNKELSDNDLINDFSMAIVPKVFKDVYDWRPHQENFRITEKGAKELEERREKNKNSAL